MATVNFARINRRSEQETLSAQSFSDELRILADTRLTEFQEQTDYSAPRHRRNSARRWIAADMSLDPEERFMVGTLGYSSFIEYHTFDDESWSWVKATQESALGAFGETVVPFAVDLRDDARWVSFVPRRGLPRRDFVRGLSSVLTTAVAEAGLFPQQWDVDVVTSQGLIADWLRRNPFVYNLRRTVKFSNPGRDLDDDRREMQNLAANRKTEEFAAPYGGILNTTAQEFSAKLDGTEDGNLEVVMKARRVSGSGPEPVFTSVDTPDVATIDNFGDDLLRGMELTLDALRDYVTTRRS